MKFELVGGLHAWISLRNVESVEDGQLAGSAVIHMKSGKKYIVRGNVDEIGKLVSSYG